MNINNRIHCHPLDNCVIHLCSNSRTGDSTIINKGDGIMRKLTYRITMGDYDKYVITNATSTSDMPLDMPSEENFSAPALRIQSEPFPKGYKMCGQTVNLDDYISPFFDCNEYPELEANYLRAIHGELEGWKLYGLYIEKNHINLEIGKDEENYVILEIVGAPCLRFSVEVPTLNGEIAKYDIMASMDDPNGLDPSNHKAYTRIFVTECGEGLDRRDIIFQNNAPFDVLYTRSEWIDVMVVEYR